MSDQETVVRTDQGQRLSPVALRAGGLAARDAALLNFRVSTGYDPENHGSTIQQLLLEMAEHGLKVVYDPESEAAQRKERLTAQAMQVLNRFFGDKPVPSDELFVGYLYRKYRITVTNRRLARQLERRFEDEPDVLVLTRPGPQPEDDLARMPAEAVQAAVDLAVSQAGVRPANTSYSISDHVHTTVVTVVDPDMRTILIEYFRDYFGFGVSVVLAERL
jgi:hypothetical protein